MEDICCAKTSLEYEKQMFKYSLRVEKKRKKEKTVYKQNIYENM